MEGLSVSRLFNNYLALFSLQNCLHDLNFTHGGVLPVESLIFTLQFFINHIFRSFFVYF